MNVLQAPSGFASSPRDEDHPGLPIPLPAWRYPSAGDLGQSSQHFSIILRALSLQHFAVSHVPTVAKRPLCFQKWEKFKLSVFLASPSNPEAQRAGLEANLT